MGYLLYISCFISRRLSKFESRHDANFVVTGDAIGMTTYGVASDNKVGIMTGRGFQRARTVLFQ